MPLTEEEKEVIINYLRSINIHLTDEQITNFPLIGYSNIGINEEAQNKKRKRDQSENLSEKEESQQKKLSSSPLTSIENLFLKVKTDLVPSAPAAPSALSHPVGEEEKDFEDKRSKMSISSDSSFILTELSYDENKIAQEKANLRERNKAGKAKLPKKAKIVIRGMVDTYAKSINFGCTYKKDQNGNTQVFIRENASISRPHSITGNLGRLAGNHVIPFSKFLHNLESRIRGRDVFDAIGNMRAVLAGMEYKDIEGKKQDSYQPLIDEAADFSRTNQNIEPGQAFEYLRMTLVPTIIALYNQGRGRAFHGKRTKEELLEEAGRVNHSNNLSNDELNENIRNFIETLDYVPVSDPSANLTEQNIRDGIRDNRVESLGIIIGDVVTQFIDDYNIDSTKTSEVAQKIIGEILDKKGWKEYYKNSENKKDLPKDFNPQALEEYLLNEVKKNNLIYFADNESYKESPYLSDSDSQWLSDSESNSKVRTQEMDEEYQNIIENFQKSLRRRYGENTDNIELIDNEGGGNCFFHAVIEGLNENGINHQYTHIDLRLLAVEKLRQTIKNDTQENSAFTTTILNHIVSTYHEMTPEEYLNHMSNYGSPETDATWVDEPLIQALSNVLNINLNIINNQHTDLPPRVISPQYPVTPPEHTINLGHIGEGHYVQIRNLHYHDQHLVRSEKIVLKQEKQVKPKFIEILTKGLHEPEKELIDKLKTEQETEVPLTKTSLKPQITLMAENDHKVDHRNNTAKLIAIINANQIDSSTVICLERKEDGANFGMRDVRLLAKLLEHNQANPESMISINEQVQKSPIYQDSMLYNVAKEKGIQVIGVEGKGLKHAKESPEYNSTRENYMASQITKIIASGKNVIFPVGASHIDSLKSKFPDALDMVVSINEGILPESANMSSSGLKQEMSQLKKPSSYILIDTAHISSPKVTPILYESKLSNLTK